MKRRDFLKSTVIGIGALCCNACSPASRTSQLPNKPDEQRQIAAPHEKPVEISFSPAAGIGPQKGIMRRDPSDIIRVGRVYYVWYSKGKVAHGYDATVWYATSPDGHTWTEKAEALARGPRGSWDEQSVFTPNILVAKGKYRLFYTAVP